MTVYLVIVTLFHVICLYILQCDFISYFERFLLLQCATALGTKPELSTDVHIHTVLQLIAQYHTSIHNSDLHHKDSRDFPKTHFIKRCCLS